MHMALWRSKRQKHRHIELTEAILGFLEIPIEVVLYEDMTSLTLPNQPVLTPKMIWKSIKLLHLRTPYPSTLETD